MSGDRAPSGSMNAKNFEAPFLMLGDVPAEHRECFAEECTDEMRLKATRLRTLHLLVDFRSPRAGRCPRTLALGEQLFDRAHVDGAVHFAEDLRLLL